MEYTFDYPYSPPQLGKSFKQSISFLIKRLHRILMVYMFGKVFENKI